jgi:periplasmic protein TonB
MKKMRIFRLLFAAGGLTLFALSLSAQQIDPFYPSLLEKAQKSFVAGNYRDAARDFEIAAFGLAGNKTLQAKAYVYLSLCRYYLKDTAGSEKSLREATALMGQEGFSSLEIYESAWPDLDKLIAFFNLGQRSNEVLPKEVAKPLPADPEAPSSKPEEPRKAQEAVPTPAAAGEGKKSTAPGSPANPKLSDIKEGDIVPRDLVDTPPVPVIRVPAAYPPQPRLLRVEGTVIVNALVSETGDVIDTKILQSIKNAAGLEQASLEAVRKWKFSPASINGLKVKVWIPIAIEFKKRP